MTTALDATPNATPLATLEAGTAYDAAAHADATRTAYTSDAKFWMRWLEEEGVNAADATPAHVAAYLAHLADNGRSAATIDRRLVAIRALYRAAGLEDPTKSDAVKRTRRGIRRTIGTAPSKAQPVRLEQLDAMLRTLPDTLLGTRDRALLLVGLAGGFRRSELAGIRVEDITWDGTDGALVLVPKSKTDQEGRGHTKEIPFLPKSLRRRCPATALRAWLEAAGIEEGPVFRSVNRHGQVSAKGISSKTVALVVKRAGEAAGIDAERLSGHSLRAGFCTNAARNGAEERDIMQQTGHRSIRTVRGYIEEAQRWTTGTAARALGGA